MNFLKKYLAILLLSLVVFPVLADASTTWQPFENAISTTEKQWTLSEKENERPLEVNKFSLLKLSESTSPQEHLSFGLYTLCFTPKKVLYTNLNVDFNSNLYLQDQRRLLSRFLYPFHFFW